MSAAPARSSVATASTDFLHRRHAGGQNDRLAGSRAGLEQIAHQQLVGSDLVEGDIGAKLLDRFQIERACKRTLFGAANSVRRAGPDVRSAVPRLPWARCMALRLRISGANMRSILKSWNFTASQPASAAASTKARARESSRPWLLEASAMKIGRPMVKTRLCP